MLAGLQESQDRAFSSAGAHPSAPAQLRPQTTNFERYNPAAFGQNAPLGRGYAPQPATAEAMPALAAAGGEESWVEEQRLALNKFKLAMESNQVCAGCVAGFKGAAEGE